MQQVPIKEAKNIKWLFRIFYCSRVVNESQSLTSDTLKCRSKMFTLKERDGVNKQQKKTEFGSTCVLVL